MANRTELAAVWPPTAAISATAGHTPISPLQAIRRKCLDCCANQYVEVRLCEAVTCSLWPFRVGIHPYTKTRLLEADAGVAAIEGIAAPVDALPCRTAFQQQGFEQGMNPLVDRPVDAKAALDGDALQQSGDR